MTTPDLIERLRAMQVEMIAEGVNGWPNTVETAIEHLSTLEASDADTVRVPCDELRDRLYEMIDGFADFLDYVPAERDQMRGRVRAYVAMLTASHPKPEPVETTVRQTSPIVADYGDHFLVAHVSKDGKLVGIDHPCDAVWSDVMTAHVALRDRINERIAAQDGCPFKPVETQPATYADFQQRRGRLPDLIEEALLIYDDFMKDDAYDAQRPLNKIAETLRSARDFYDMETQPEASRSPVEEERAALEAVWKAIGDEERKAAMALVYKALFTPSPQPQAPSEEAARIRALADRLER